MFVGWELANGVDAGERGRLPVGTAYGTHVGTRKSTYEQSMST
jgi:hypothetical protein